jgi:hypothetical protein
MGARLLLWCVAESYVFAFCLPPVPQCAGPSCLQTSNMGEDISEGLRQGSESCRGYCTRGMCRNMTLSL